MSDMISRQAAFDALRDAENQAFNSYYKGLIKAHKIIADLPSAQPEQSNTSEFWRKRADFYSDMCMNLIGEMGKGVKIESVKISENGIEFIKGQPSVQPEPCEDAVSRRRLLSDLKELIAAWKKYPVMAEQIKGVEAAIGYVEVIPSVNPDSKELSLTQKALDNDLPSAQPKRETGQWLDNETTFSETGRQTATCSVCGLRSPRPLGEFCRWCGAQMTEGDDKNEGD